MFSLARLAVPAVAPRAAVVWALIRLVAAALPLAGGQPFGSMPPSPLGIVILSGAVGLMDVRVRGERILWANLGMTTAGLMTIYAAAAVAGEVMLVLVLR